MFSNLSDREKKLALLASLILPLAAFYYGFTTYQSMKKAAVRDKNIAEKRLSDLDLLEMEALDCRADLDALVSYSLPTSIQKHIQPAQYLNWLEKLATDSGMKISTVGNSQPSIKPFSITDPRTEGTNEVSKVVIYHTLKYKMSLRGDIQSITKFMHSFYDAGLIQQFERVQIGHPKRSAKKGLLSLEVDIVAFILPEADDTRSFENVPVGKLKHDLAHYETILRRNIFGGVNKAPSLSMSSSLKLEPGDDISTEISAEDDPLHTLKMELVDSDIDGLKLVINEDDPTQAELVAPEMKKEGRFFAKVKVTDNGFPALTTTETLVVNIKKPKPRKKYTPPPKKKIKHAPETFITFIGNDVQGKWWVYLDQRLKGKNLKLGVGDEFEMDEKKWKLVEVATRKAVFHRDNEKLYFNSGTFLDAPYKKESISSVPAKATAKKKVDSEKISEAHVATENKKDLAQ